MFFRTKHIFGHVPNRQHNHNIIPTKISSPTRDYYCLNDLPKNDFNTTFKLVPSFNKEVKGKCFVSGVPGTFYSRLFPKKSLHFIHSSFSIHWLSKVPQGLEDNENNVYIRSGCSLDVCKSYMNQFQNDFSLFLRLRSEEMLPSGRMVLTISGKKDLDPLFRDGFLRWALLSDALADLVSEVLILYSLTLLLTKCKFRLSHRLDL